MAHEEQTILAPTQTYGRSDEEQQQQQTGPTIWRRKTDKKPGNCLVYSLTLLVISFAVCLILSLIFLRVTIPEIETNQIRTEDLKFNGNNNSSSAYFNATLISEITIRNSNFGDFEYGNSSLKFAYGTHGVVGEGMISGGVISAHKTVRLTGIAVKIGSFWLLNLEKDLESDLRTGFLELSSVVEIVGSVEVFGKRRWKLSVMSCSMSLNLSKRFIQNLLCV